MASKEYYERWLKIKTELERTLIADAKLDGLAKASVGLKPQGTAVELVGRVYAQYCALFNRLCEYYDQMDQVQRRPYIRKIIDALTCRILELKTSLEKIEVFEFTYPDNALQQMLMIPKDIEILCPFFYPLETRQQEMQCIMDEIFAGNRIGDMPSSPSELERREQARVEEEARIRQEKEEEIIRKLAMGEDIVSVQSTELSPEEKEKRRLEKEYRMHITNIQRMERSRYTIREKTKKFNKDAALYLELTGLKKPEASEYMKHRAAGLIQKICRQFMNIKRQQLREKKLREKLQMIIPAVPKPSAKTELNKVQEIRRRFRQNYYEKFLQENIKEKTHILQLKEGYIIDDITTEIRNWFHKWYDNVRIFDEFPYPEEGGSILIVRGDTFSIEEYIEWQAAEEKRLKEESGNPKTKEQIKREKLEAKLEKKRLEKEAVDKERKRLLDYKKSRLNPENDPGIYINVGKHVEGLQQIWEDYQHQWKDIDLPNVSMDVIQGFIHELITEDVYQDINLQLRVIVDEMMRLELDQLRKSLKKDYEDAGVKKIPQSEKRSKPKKPKPPKTDKIRPAFMFQQLFDQNIIKVHPRLGLDDFLGDRNYAAADMRAVEWTPSFPPPCLGDVREQVRVRCLLALGSKCPNANRSQLLVGPKGSGKKTLIYALASETKALLIDLSPINIYNKFPGPKHFKRMFYFINRISRLMQPTIIMIADADKVFCKKVPPEEKWFDPTRLQKDLFKEIVKPITQFDKIIVIGTASEPWLSKPAPMSKVFQSLILFPMADYGSISFILKSTLMKYHGIDREFNVHSLAQALRGFDIETIKKALQTVLDGKRIPELYHKPLQPIEIVNAALEICDGNYLDPSDYDMFKQWYLSFSSWGPEYTYYMGMLESQLAYKIKNAKKK